MALIKCPECGNEVSEFATACPKCGCPIHEVLAAVESNQRSVSGRTIVFKRVNAQVGSAMGFDLYFDDKFIHTIDNGVEFSLEGVDSNPHSFFVLMQTPLGYLPEKTIDKARKKAIKIPAGTDNLTFEMSPGLGLHFPKIKQC